MKKLNNLIEKNISKIILIFLFIQPFLDILTSICLNCFKIETTISSIVRLIFMIFCIYYLLILDKTTNKKRNIIFLILFLIYMIFYSISVLYFKDINAFTYEIKNTLNTFYLPITLISFIDIFKQYKIEIDFKKIIYLISIYIILVLVPNIFNIGFNSYAHSKLGKVGWFLSANAVGNILSIYTPLVIYYLLKSKTNIYLKIFLGISCLYVFLSMGTKVPILSLLICLIVNLIIYIIYLIKIKNIKNILLTVSIFIIITISSIVVVPKTSFYKNIQIHKNYLHINSYTEVLTDYKLMDHFIFSQRLTFLNNTHKNYSKSTIYEKLIGIGYIENYMTDKVSIKTIEIDYFEILYRNGILGFILYFYIFIIYLIESIKSLKEKNLINKEYKLSIFLVLILSLFSGHILVTPMVSIFVALLFTMIIYKIKEF